MSRRGRWLLAIAAALLLGLPLAPRSQAEAHPLGNFTINRYARIEVYRDALRVHYVLDYAEIPALQLLQSIGSQGGDATPAELDAYAAKVAGQLAANLTLSLDGESLALTPLESHAEALPGQGGLQTVRVAIVYQAPVRAAGAKDVAFEDRNFANRAGWKEIVVRPSEGALVKVAPTLTVDQSDALRSYPAEDLRSAPDVRTAQFTWTAGTGAPAPAAAGLQPAGAGRATHGLAGLADDDGSWLVMLLALLAALGFGALHALGPGHGKTVVAAYLVGSRGTPRHALALGFTVTATHTASVYALGFITLAASSWILPETLYLYLGVASGAMVVAMGLVLLAGRLWRLRTPSQEATHRHGFFGRAHEHGPDHGHDHAATNPHGHAHEPGARDHANVSWRGLLTLGVAGGLLPCPSAIVVMLAAISLGKVAFGMLLIVAFSLGLAGVLTAIGMALVVGRRLSAHTRLARGLSHPALARATAALPVLSALGVTIAGCGITWLAVSY